MLKKLMSFLFEEEEEEIYTDGELEEALFKDVPQKNITPESMASQVKTEPHFVAKSKPISNPPVTPVAPQAPSQEPKKFTSIDLEPKKEVAFGNQQVTRRKPIMADTIRVEKPKSDFNVAPVISPIFGSNDENNSSPLEAKVPATGINKQRKSIDIISPMYGLSEPEEAALKKAKAVEGKRHAAPKFEIEDITELQELPDLPLEAMIKKEDDVEDDSMQISLFGEDAPIHEDAASDYKIEE